MRWVMPLLLLVLPLAAEEDRVNFEFKEEKAKRVAQVIATYSGAKITVDPEYHDRKVTLSLKKATWKEACVALAKQLGGTFWEERRSECRIAPKWSIALRKKVVATRLAKGSLKPATLGDSLEFLRAVTGLNLVADAELDLESKATGLEKEASLGQALDKVCADAKCTWSVRWGVIYIATKKRLDALPYVPPIPETGRLVDLSFRENTLAQCVGYLSAALGGANIKMAKGVDSKVKVTVMAHRIDGAHALALVLFPIGRAAKTQGDFIEVR